MNPLLASGLLSANNALGNNGLTSSSSFDQALSESPEFTGAFAELWQQLAEISGNTQPPGLAALQELDPALLDSLLQQQGQPQPLLPGASPINSLNILPGISTMSDNSLLNTPGNSSEFKRGELGLPVLDKAALQSGLSQNDVIKNAVINTQSISEQSVQEEIEPDMLQQLAGLKSLLGEPDSKTPPATLMQELQNTRLPEQFSAPDKINLTGINSVNPALAQSISKQEHPTFQLPRIEVPVNQAEWGRSVGDRLMLMVNNKVQSAHILLNPPELGPIEVRVNMNQDQASVHFVSNHSAVRDAIEEAFPRLREMFAQNGLSLADANVSQQSSQQGRHFNHEQGDALATTAQHDIEHHDAEQEHVQIIDAGLIDHYV